MYSETRESSPHLVKKEVILVQMKQISMNSKKMCKAFQAMYFLVNI